MGTRADFVGVDFLEADFHDPPDEDDEAVRLPGIFTGVMYVGAVEAPPLGEGTAAAAPRKGAAAPAAAPAPPW